MTDSHRSNYIHSIDAGIVRFNRKTKEVEILLVKRVKEPFINQWALPGIVINGDTQDDSIEMAVERLIHSPKVGLAPKYIEQVETVGNGTRDPRCWSSSTIYLAIIDDTYQIEGEKKFVNIRDIESDKITLPFDHNILVRKLADRLWSKSLYSSMPLLMLPEMFSTPNAIDVFSIVLNRPVGKSSMRVRMAKLVENGFIVETNQKARVDAGRLQSQNQNLKNNEIYLFDRCFEQ